MARVQFDYEKANNIVVTPLKKKLVAIGFEIEREAKRLCPVDTGRLRASISTNWSNSGMSEGNVGSGAEVDDGVGNPGVEENKFTVVVGTRVTYAPFVEFGTSRMGNTPFMRAAFEQFRDITNKLTGK